MPDLHAENNYDEAYYNDAKYPISFALTYYFKEE